MWQKFIRSASYLKGHIYWPIFILSEFLNYWKNKLRKDKPKTVKSVMARVSKRIYHWITWPNPLYRLLIYTMKRNIFKVALIKLTLELLTWGILNHLMAWCLHRLEDEEAIHRWAVIWQVSIITSVCIIHQDGSSHINQGTRRHLTHLTIHHHPTWSTIKFKTHTLKLIILRY